MTTDITELAQRLKAAAEKATPGPWGVARDGKTLVSNQSHPIATVSDAMHRMLTDGSTGKDAEFIALANPANIIALVEALEKAQQSVELVDLQRDKIKRLESDLWDKEQLRKVHSEKSFELEGKVRELEARNQKDFVWRGEEIGRLNDEVDELKEKLESRTVKLPDDEDGQAYGFGKWANGKLPATAGTMTIAYCEDAWRAAFEVFSSAAGIKWEAE